jgi:hypothetical protein
MRETSQTLAKNVYEQLVDQLALSDPSMGNRVRPQVGGGGGRPGSACWSYQALVVAVSPVSRTGISLA